MKNLSKVFSVFLALSLVMAVSYCCCIKEALAKQNHACCAQKSDRASHHQQQDCPKVLSSLSDQSLNINSSGAPELTLAQSIQPILKLDHPIYHEQLSLQDSLRHSSKIPLYITHHNFRI